MFDDFIDFMTDRIMTKHGLSKREARKILGNALFRNIVVNEIDNMVHYIVTGDIPE